MHPAAVDEFKNAYSVEFLELKDGHSEADLHGALLRDLGRFITELGRDFCFVGSEYPVQVGSQDFAIDLVFFRRRSPSTSRCFLPRRCSAESSTSSTRTSLRKQKRLPKQPLPSSGGD
jgi:predicted nuclease of restriction endonuclease-like (RecB) superfamily